MFFESNHSLHENEFRIWTSTECNFPLHIHRAFEYFEQISGSTEIMINSQKHTLNAGEAVLIFPLQAHSYATMALGEIRLCIFSPDIVNAFYKKRKDKAPVDNRFFCNFPNDLAIDNIFHQKAVAYLICGEFDKGRKYIDDVGKSSDQFLIPLLLYADKNFRTQFQLRDVAAAIGYDYSYVSKSFKKKIGISFKQYVSKLRVIEAKHLLTSTAKTIEEICEETGFGSLRTLDREFKSQTGLSPSEYRKQETGRQDPIPPPLSL